MLRVKLGTQTGATATKIVDINTVLETVLEEAGPQFADRRFSALVNGRALSAADRAKSFADLGMEDNTDVHIFFTVKTDNA